MDGFVPEVVGSDWSLPEEEESCFFFFQRDAKSRFVHKPNNVNLI